MRFECSLCDATHTWRADTADLFMNSLPAGSLGALSLSSLAGNGNAKAALCMRRMELHAGSSRSICILFCWFNFNFYQNKTRLPGHIFSLFFIEICLPKLNVYFYFTNKENSIFRSKNNLRNWTFFHENIIDCLRQNNQCSVVFILILYSLIDNFLRINQSCSSRRGLWQHEYS
jgi:hypothetical protein